MIRGGLPLGFPSSGTSGTWPFPQTVAVATATASRAGYTRTMQATQSCAAPQTMNKRFKPFFQVTAACTILCGTVTLAAALILQQHQQPQRAQQTEQTEQTESYKNRNSCRDKPFWICPDYFDTDEEYQAAVEAAQDHRERAQAKAAQKKAKRELMATIRQKACDLIDADPSMYRVGRKVYINDAVFHVLSVWQKNDLVDGIPLCTGGDNAIYSHYTGRQLW